MARNIGQLAHIGAFSPPIPLIFTVREVLKMVRVAKNRLGIRLQVPKIAFEDMIMGLRVEATLQLMRS